MTGYTSNIAFKWFDRWGVGLCLLPVGLVLRLIRIFRINRSSPRIRRILLSKFCCQGDALLSLPAIKSLKIRYPEAELWMLAGNKTREVYEFSGLFTRILHLNISGSRGLREMKSTGILTLLKNLVQSGPFDTYIDLDLYYHFSTLTGLWIQAPSRIGFSTTWMRKIIFTKTAERKKRQHEMDCFFDLMACLDVTRPEKPFYALPVPSESRNQARDLLKSLGWNGSDPLIALLPGSSGNWPQKRWPVHHFSEFIDRIRATGPYFFVLLGLPEENSLTRFLCNRFPQNTADLSGKTDFLHLTGTLSLCSLFVGNDSGPMHLADMLGIPTLAIFGPTDEKKWAPLGPHSRVMTLETISCRPCYYLSRMPSCPHVRCLADLPVPWVTDTAMQMIRIPRGGNCVN